MMKVKTVVVGAAIVLVGAMPALGQGSRRSGLDNLGSGGVELLGKGGVDDLGVIPPPPPPCVGAECGGMASPRLFQPAPASPQMIPAPVPAPPETVTPAPPPQFLPPLPDRR